MPTKLKILVIRFSSIGDIILTTPVVRCLNIQLNAEIDFLTKRKYKTLLSSNPYISEIFTLEEDAKPKLDFLRDQHYNLIIDLQNNFRSLRLRLALGVKSYIYQKDIFKRYVLLYLGINLLNNHIVDRYFKSVLKLNVYNDSKGIDYYTTKPLSLEFNTNQDYICWCIGGSYEQKKLSYTQIADVISKLNIPVLLLGSEKDKILSAEISDNCKSANVYDFCGGTSIEESAYFIEQSKLVLTNDTGMMHIASAFDNPIISFWGCTKPSLGFAPYLPNKKSENIITKSSEIPCSKHGQNCRVSSNGCIKDIRSQLIYNTILKLLK
ncbi:MAG: hypothetical protein CMD16_01775 [Flavobacteriales bacterium]|nr:hypothetical protein [Flavobacteriales bacterium]|tara:strand:+ start:2274 stop:3242 length:969 start_codon:yes stop_codon:yes gene_type:complete